MWILLTSKGLDSRFLLKTCRDRFRGNDGVFPMGAKGAVAATGTAFPEPVVQIYESLREGNRDKALKAQEGVIRLRAVLRSYPPISAYKKACEFRGIQAGPPCLPLRPLTSEEEKKLRGELEALGLL